MKRFLLILLIMLITTTNAAAYSNKQEEMASLSELVTENDLIVENWQVTIKEQMKIGRINRLMKKLQQENSYLFSSEKDDNSIRYSFRNIQKDKSISETYNVLIPKDTKYKAQLIVVIEGNSWSETIEKSYFRKVNLLKKEFFSENSTKFACLNTTLSDKMSSDYFFKKMKESLNLLYIKTQVDTVENSTIKEIIYGYTSLWGQEIITMDKPMNLQMAIKNSENGTTKLTIGTPILITEY